MKGLVSITDRSWFDFLSAWASERDGRLDEVNFWRPRDQRPLRKIPPGAPFFLRLKKPVHRIAGFGFFAHWNLLPFAEAWAAFGEKNGAPSFAVLRENITRLRGEDPAGPNARPIGCVILRDVTFLEEREWIPWREAQGWHRNIQNDLTYDLAHLPGSRLLELVLGRYPTPTPPEFDERFELVTEDERLWRDRIVPVREGQQTFRLRLLDAYGHRCALTGQRVVPVLEAAHIQSYMGPRSNHLQNGLLLRSDLHHLYDEGYLTITPDATLLVSDRIREEFANGTEYYELRGRRLVPPRNPQDAPSRAALAWHAKNKFR